MAEIPGMQGAARELGDRLPFASTICEAAATMAGMSDTAESNPPASRDITRLLHEADDADSHAASQLLTAVYDELRKLAAARLAREKPGQTLQATALVHEAYLRLLGTADPGWRGRAHFFGAAAEAMRRILVEQARRKASAKHGGDHVRVELHDSVIATSDESTDLLALDEALERLQREDPRRAQLVKLRYFAGLTSAEAAQAMNISHATAERYWAYSRIRLYQWMKGA
jgi:RNA polymerase sigma factor (TIGR02999 family)